MRDTVGLFLRAKKLLSRLVSRGRGKKFAPELIRRQLEMVALLQDDVSILMGDLAFLFDELAAIDFRYESELKAKFALLAAGNPSWSPEQSWDFFTADRSNAIVYVKANRAKNRVYQCLAILISNWLKSKTKTYCRILAKLSSQSDQQVFDELTRTGPIYKKKFWAEALVKISDFVRHRDEWHFNGLVYDPVAGQVKSRKRIIRTLEYGPSRRTAQFLIELGVKENSLFGVSGDACTQAFVQIASNDRISLESNCRAWLAAIKSQSESTVARYL